MSVTPFTGATPSWDGEEVSEISNKEQVFNPMHGGYPVAEANFCGPVEGEVYVDSMLGWLARWIRMLGRHAYYDSNYSDVFLSGVDGLVITRDAGLHRSRRGASLLLFTDDHAAWLAVTSKVLGLGLSIDMRSTLCPECGGRLVRVGREEVAGRVPMGVAASHSDFFECVDCGKIYWVGSHRIKIDTMLHKAMDLSKRINSICIAGGTIFKID